MKRLRQRIKLLERRVSSKSKQPYAWTVKDGETSEEALARLNLAYPDPSPVVLIPEEETMESFEEKYER